MGTVGMKPCDRPGCLKPATNKYCSRRCAGLALTAEQRRLGQERRLQSVRAKAASRLKEEGADLETSRRFYKMGYMKAARNHSPSRVLQRLRRAVSVASGDASPGSRTAAVPPKR